jgi:serine/threonine protein kinase
MEPEPSVVWNQPGEERIPRSFGRLWLLRRLARGGMGEVYLAATFGIEGAERPCVVKIIRRDHAGDKSFVARFLDEARVQAQLQHHGVAQVLDASTDPQGEPYVVVEYVEGRSLGEVRARAVQLGIALEWPDVVAIGVSIAEALAHVHERTDATGKPLGIVHRDLSPQNIMVAYDGDLKLIDFGTARAENRRCHTIAGVVFAKPGYVAPEVANGIPGDFHVDIYALGVMLWELLAGRRFLQGDAGEHLAQVAKNERNLSAIAAACGAPPELDRVLAELTAFDPQRRCPSARRAASELVKMLAKAPGLATGERGVRARVAHLLRQLYPSEPAKSRAEFGSLVKATRWAVAEEAKLKDELRLKAAVSEQLPGAAEMSAPADASLALQGETADMLPGTRYRLLCTIGKGAMGVVYEAEHVDLARRVALKVMAPELGSATAYAARFRREAQAIARVSHPNLVATHDFGEASDGRLFCAMERLEGRTLEQWCSQEPRMHWQNAVRLGILACRGLQAAHGAGVVHRDLKPANLFLTTAAVAPGEPHLDDLGAGLKILDFGIAGNVDAGLDPAGLSGGEFKIVGTPEYMAPEQARSCDVDARADVYALASVLYELCTGRPPYVGASPVDILRQKSVGPPEPMRARAPALDLPVRLDRVLTCALHPLASGRYPSALDFRVALENVLAASDRRRVASRAVGYVALAAVGLFAVGVLGARLARPAAFAEKPRPSLLPVSMAPGFARDALGTETASTVAASTVAASTVAANAELNAALDANGARDSVSPVDAKTADALRPGQATKPSSSSIVAPGGLADADSAQREVTASADKSAQREVTASADKSARRAPRRVAAPRALPNRPKRTVASARAQLPRARALAAPASPLGDRAASELTVPQVAAPELAAPEIPAPDPTALALADATASLGRNAPEQALSTLRDAVRHNRGDVRLVRAWAEAAAAAHAWAEACDAAEQWSHLEAGNEPRLFLARMHTYRGSPMTAVRILDALLDAHPECAEARALHREYLDLLRAAPQEPRALPPQPDGVEVL